MLSTWDHLQAVVPMLTNVGQAGSAFSGAHSSVPVKVPGFRSACSGLTGMMTLQATFIAHLDSLNIFGGPPLSRRPLRSWCIRSKRTCGLCAMLSCIGWGGHPSQGSAEPDSCAYLQQPACLGVHCHRPKSWL